MAARLATIATRLLVGFGAVIAAVIIKCWLADDVRNLVVFSITVSLGVLILVSILMYIVGRLLRDD